MVSLTCTTPIHQSLPRIRISIFALLLAIATCLTAIPSAQASSFDGMVGSLQSTPGPVVDRATMRDTLRQARDAEFASSSRDRIAASNALLQTGHGKFTTRTLGGEHLRVFSYRPPGFDPRSGRIWFVLHGALRDAEHYAHLAARSADRYDTLVLAVEFNRDLYPSSELYSLGIVSSGNPNWRAYREDRLLEPEAFAFNEIERVFDEVRDTLGGTQSGYYLFGHSAGAQFVHRMLTFLPGARVNGAVAANAGWYTLPFDDSRSGMRLPYSLYGLPQGFVNKRSLLGSPLTILLGSDDTSLAVDNPNLRSNTGAMEQGPHRLARGLNYYLLGRDVAEGLGIPFRWNVQEVPDVGHNARWMIPPAAHILFAEALSGN